MSACFNGLVIVFTGLLLIVRLLCVFDAVRG